MGNPIKEAQRLGQSIWLDFIGRGLINTGQLEELIDKGICGMTSNPTIFHKAITQGTDYDNAIRDILNPAPDIETEALYDRLIKQKLGLVYEEGAGWVKIQ